MLGLVPIGSVRKLVALSLPPSSMILFLYHTVHFNLSNRTLHPALVSMTMPKWEAMESSGMMCPVRTTGSPLMCTSNMCVDVTWLPSASDTVNRHVVGHWLTTGIPSMMKIALPPSPQWCPLLSVGMRYRQSVAGVACHWICHI
jgi:hypothetical protein